ISSASPNGNRNAPRTPAANPNAAGRAPHAVGQRASAAPPSPGPTANPPNSVTDGEPNDRFGHRGCAGSIASLSASFGAAPSATHTRCAPGLSVPSHGVAPTSARSTNTEAPGLPGASRRSCPPSASGASAQSAAVSVVVTIATDLSHVA